jgi:hypothetical protein
MGGPDGPDTNVGKLKTQRKRRLGVDQMSQKGHTDFSDFVVRIVSVTTTPYSFPLGI